MLLALDSAGFDLAFALHCGDTILTHSAAGGRAQSARLFPELLDFLAQHRLSFADIRSLAVANGPGSFTGLRVGHAAFNGLALALNCALLGEDHFTLSWHGLPPALRCQRDTLLLLESQRAELYAQHWQAAGTPAAPPMLLTLPQVQDFLRAQKDPFYVAGNAALKLLQTAPAEILSREILPPEFLSAEFSPVQVLAQRGAAGLLKSAELLYVRAPDVSVPKIKPILDPDDLIKTLKINRPSSKAMPLSLRALTLTDAPWLAHLQAACFPDTPWDAPAFIKLLQLPSCCAWVLSAGDDPAAFILLQVAGDEAEIISLGVAPAQRGQGLGLHVLMLALAVLPDTVVQVHLEVAADNFFAQKIYAAAGFQLSGLRPAYYARADGSRQDAQRWLKRRGQG